MRAGQARINQERSPSMDKKISSIVDWVSALNKLAIVQNEEEHRWSGSLSVKEFGGLKVKGKGKGYTAISASEGSWAIA